MSPADRQARYLQTDHLDADLGGNSVRGGTITVVVRGVGLVTRTAALAVLARLVTKEDFGLIFAISAVTNLLDVLKDLGLSTATQQKDVLDHRQVTSLFWINLGMAVLLAAATAALAPGIAWLYGGDARILPIVLVYAAMHIVDALGVQHGALLARQMRFGSIAGLNITALITGRCAAIAAASAGAGYWALVVMAAVSKVVYTIGAWCACGWRPSLPSRTPGIDSMLRFGRNLTGVRVLQQITRNADSILLGTFAGEAATGLFGNAKRLLDLPTQTLSVPLNGVALPALSRLQHRPGRFVAYYQKALLLLATVGFPLVVFCFCAADAIVVTVLGPQWAEAGTILRILAPAAFLTMVGPAVEWVYHALGRTDRQVRWVAVTSPLHVLAMGIGAAWGAVGVATGFTVARVGLWVPALLYCLAGTPIRVRAVFAALWQPAAACLGAAVVLGLGSSLVSGAHDAWVRLVASLAFFTVGYVVSWLVVPGGPAVLGAIVQMTQHLRSRGARDNARTDTGTGPVVQAGGDAGADFSADAM